MWVRGKLLVCPSAFGLNQRPSGDLSECVHQCAYHFERFCGAHSAEASVGAQRLYRHECQSTGDKPGGAALDICLCTARHMVISFLKVYSRIVCKFLRKYPDIAAGKIYLPRLKCHTNGALADFLCEFIRYFRRFCAVCIYRGAIFW